MCLYRHEFAICPWCSGQTGARLDHLYSETFPREVGPWFCDACGKPFKAKVTAPSEVEVTRAQNCQQRFTRSMALLRLEGRDGPIFFVMDHKRYRDGKGVESDADNQSHQRYVFEEGSCPTNWIGECVAVIENGDTDPHGFMKFIRAVDVPQDFDLDDEDRWSALFPEAFGGRIIDGELARKRIALEKK